MADDASPDRTDRGEEDQEAGEDAVDLGDAERADLSRTDKKPRKKGKKGKKEEEKETYKFEVPDFDEEAFIHKELTGFHTTIILFAWGIVAALLSWGIFGAMGANASAWYATIILAVLMGYLLKWIFPALKADISHYERRQWLGTAFLYGFTWLAVFILLMNPPISDFSAPATDIYVNPPLQQVDQPLVIDIFASDNDAVSGTTFTVTRGTTAIADGSDLERAGADHWRYTATGLPAGTYDYRFTATDGAGHESDHNGTFRIASRALDLELPGDERLDSRTDIVLVTIAEDIPLRTVYLDMTDRDTQIHMEHDATLGGYKATANFAGWQEGTNTFNVLAEQPNHFHGTTLVEGGILRLTGPFTLEVTAQPGDYTPTVEPADTTPPTRQVPGLGTVAVLGALGAMAVVARRRSS